MTRLLLVLLLVLGPAGVARADASSEFGAGIDAAGRGDNDAAVRHLSEAIRVGGLPPEQLADAHRRRGDAYRQLGKHGQAIDDYETATGLKSGFAEHINPDLAAAYSERGDALLKQGSADLAIQDYDKAIGLKPDHGAAFVGRGNAYLRKGDYDRAVADYDSAIRFGADAASVHANRGNAYLSKGLHNRAIEDYSAAIRLKPNAADAYASRGNVYLLRGHYDRAIEDLDNAIRLDAQLAPAYTSRGNARLNKRLYAEAIADYDKALALNPGDDHAFKNRAVAEKNLQSRDRADRIAKQRVEASKGPHPSLVRRAQKLLGQLGYAVGTADGTIGPRTRDAVRAFQREDGLAMDGRIEVPLVRRLEAAVARAASRAAAERAKQQAAEAEAIEPPNPIEIVEAADHRIASVDMQGAVMAIMIDVGNSPSATRHVNEVTEALAKIVPTVRAATPEVSQLFVFSIAEIEDGQGAKNQGPVIAFVLPMAELRAVNLAHIGRNRVLDMTSVVVSRSGRDLLAEYCSEGNRLIQILQTGAGSASLFTRAFRWMLPGYGSHFCLVTLQNAPVHQSAFLTTADLLNQP